MNYRDIKKDCYLDLLEEEIVSVEAVMNQLHRLKSHNGLFDESIIKRDIIKTQFHLELALASLCILLRKMSENQFICITQEKRRDMNSIIHSNKFEFYDEDLIYVYSQKGKEEVSIQDLLNFARSVL